MPMHDVRLQFLDDLVSSMGRGDVARADMALHRRAPDAERQQTFHVAEQLFLERPAGRRIADDADGVAVRDLRFREVAHMPENAADRGAKAVNDAERSRQWL